MSQIHHVTVRCRSELLDRTLTLREETTAARRTHRAECAQRKQGREVELTILRHRRQEWFLSLHVFTRYIKVTFFSGTSLRPVPPGGTGKDARWIDIREDDLDENQMASWIKQAAALPGFLRPRP